tara:strand:- start:11512 stop:13224 length:1713 start_codon:yes stop_codon:yes gene_type:complete
MSSLIIALDVDLKDRQVKKGDIILHNNPEYYSRVFESHTLFNLNVDLSETDTEVTNGVNDFFKQLPNELSFLKNKVYSRIFRPICSVILQVNSVLKLHSISRIILHQGNEIDFSYLKGGIGEGQKKMFKASWFFNFYLFQFFRNDIEVLWCRTPRIYLRTILYVRSLINILNLILKSFRSFFKKNHKETIVPSNNKTTILAFVSGLTQYKRVLDIVDTYYRDCDICFLSNEDSKVSKQNVVPNLIKIKSIAIKSFLINYFKFRRIKKSFNNANLYFKVYNKEICIESKLFFTSIEDYVVYNFAAEFEFKKEFIKHQLESSKVLFLSVYTFGDEILLIRSLAKDRRVKHVNFQTVTMAKILLPDLSLADEYYLYSYRTFEFYKKYASCFKYYFNVKDLDIDNVRNQELGNYVLTIYTQPDIFADFYLELINLIALIIESDNLSWKVFIKFHYRQNKITDFYELESKFDFISILDKDIDIVKSFNNTSFMMSIGSSVLYEAIIYSCPGIIAQFNYIDDGYVFGNDICFPEVNFNITDKNHLREIFLHPEEYIDDYNKRRNLFVSKNKLLSEI